MTQLPNFDTLKWLAEHKPDQLEQLQQLLTSEVISSSTRNRQQLECLHFNLQQQLKKCDNPYQRCHVVMGLMNDKLYSLSDAVNDPLNINENKGVVLPFKKMS